jgi:ubiquinone/menaquinone biosynthesis C-methylase UbiE
MATAGPYSAILGHVQKPGSRLEGEECELYGTGGEWVTACMKRLEDLDWRVHHDSRVLDFGCGVGRLTRPLAARFDFVVGVDFSKSMVMRPHEACRHRKKLAFLLHGSRAPLPFEDRKFDLVVCVNVLQYQADEQGVKRWLRELVRVLKPEGALVVQLPSSTSRRRGSHWWLLPVRLIRRGIAPISTLAVAQRRVREIVEEAGGQVLAVDVDERSGPLDFPSSTYYVSRSGA